MRARALKLLLRSASGAAPAPRPPRSTARYTRYVIRTVIFDLGKVIVPFDFQRGYDAISEICSCPAEEIPRRIGSTDLVQRFETGLIDPQDFVRQFSAILGLDISYEEFCRVWSSIFLPETLIPESLVAGLKARYRLLLLSNTNAIHFAMIRENYPIIRHFEGCILSYKVGALKPSEKIYREAIAQAECRPEEIFFTDDILSYVEAAQREGIDAVQFESLPQLESELRARGIEW
jgi:FMN phosphatase YigB (HAD superfamily)